MGGGGYDNYDYGIQIKRFQTSCSNLCYDNSDCICKGLNVCIEKRYMYCSNSCIKRKCSDSKWPGHVCAIF